MDVLSSSISSRSRFTSSCTCCRSVCSFPMCSTVFCSVTALLVWRERDGEEEEQWCESSRETHQVEEVTEVTGVSSREVSLTLDCDLRAGTRLQSVLKPNLMCVRLFCSAEMWVVLRPCGVAVRGAVRGRKHVPMLLTLLNNILLPLANLVLFILDQRRHATDKRLWARDLIQPTRGPLS